MKENLFFLFLFYTAILFAQEVSRQKNDSIYSSILNTAFNYTQTGEPNEAIKLCNKALEYAKKENVDSLKARAYNILSVVFLDLEDKETSFEHLIKSKNIYLKLNDSLKLTSVYNNIGVFYGDNGVVDSSNVYYKKGMKIAKAINSKNSMFILSYNIGYNYGMYKGDYKNAMLYLNKALSLQEYSDQNHIKGKLYRAIGYVKKSLKKYDEAHKCFDKSIAVYKKHGYLPSLVEVYGYKSEAYKEQNNLFSANDFLLKQIVIKDSIEGIEKEDLAKEIEAKYKLKVSKEKFKFIEKENSVQKKLLAKSTLFNWLLAFLMILLLFTAYWIYTKNKELKKARDRAEALSKVKSNFYSEISHELRTPLYAVIELSSLLLKENINSKHQGYLASLKYSGTQLLSLINNVLQLNKIEESGALKLEYSVFNLKNVITTIINSLEYALKDSGNTIALEFDDSIPQKLKGDSLKLSQVLTNLISNAIKFTNHGHIEVFITKIKSKKQKGKTSIFFKISDNGPGISKENQLLVFEDYYQEHSKNDNSYKGTGLGLSIVKSTLEAMNSRIGIESEEGKGTSFYFTIQLAKEKADKEETSDRQLEIIKKYKLLVVDDNKINQLVTKKVLDQLSVYSEIAGSGEKAIALVKTNHYDCVLMDLHMPKIDGYETSKRIRSFNKRIPIVALTAAAPEEIEKKINSVSMNGYILKPFLMGDFVSTIVRAVKKNNA